MSKRKVFEQHEDLQELSYYTIIPMYLILDEDLTDGAKFLYGIVESLSNNADKPYCYASNKYLAKRLNVSSATIKRYLKQLEDEDYIVRESIEDDKGQIVQRRIYTSDRYIQVKGILKQYKELKEDNDNDQLSQGGSILNLPQLNSEPTPQLKNEPHNNKDNNNKDNIKDNTIVQNDLNESESSQESSIKDDELEEEFESIWQDYPRKQGKAKAKKEYIKYRHDGVSKDEIAEGVKSYAKYIEDTNTPQKYTKMGDTFFRNKSWQDTWKTEESSRKANKGRLTRRKNVKDHSDYNDSLDIFDIKRMKDAENNNK